MSEPREACTADMPTDEITATNGCVYVRQTIYDALKAEVERLKQSQKGYAPGILHALEREREINRVLVEALKSYVDGQRCPYAKETLAKVEEMRQPKPTFGPDIGEDGEIWQD
jgi:hypothetical protein